MFKKHAYFDTSDVITKQRLRSTVLIVSSSYLRCCGFCFRWQSVFISLFSH